MAYNSERYERMLIRIQETKRLAGERYRKFLNEYEVFNKMVNGGKVDTVKMRKQWNKVNVHLIRYNDLENKIEEYYNEAWEAHKF